jgi:hypothetical protein
VTGQKLATRWIRTAAIVVIGLAGVAALVFAAGVIGGLFPIGTSAFTSCDELATRERVVAALASHRELADAVRAQGDTVTVGVGTPCSDQPDGALIEVGYTKDDELRRISDLLSVEDGFGITAYAVKR